ncbi:hypothetical protein BDM02DRAFT_3182152 [Thelephora ganbajun]|uniref:Uncharacterized protein n=1 Tax=Thelephora ganbajun TaxID=370292 RepID=A0ACB6ZZG1_THEGA|nr:hypothetical protein BDM02DRAFT_3182152 [Thelephora ganbajun]
MDDAVLLGTDVHSEPPQPMAMTSTVHRHSLARSQITVLDIDLANALSVAPAPHSWKDAERVLSEFGGNFPAPMSVDTNNPSPHKGYFVGDIKNSGESFYAYFIEDGDVVYDPPEEIPIPRPAIIDQGRFREVVDGQNSDVTPDSYRAMGLGAVENSSSSDQEGVPPPVMRKRPSEDKRRKRISQVIVDASKRSKRRMTSCTIQ